MAVARHKVIYLFDYCPASWHVLVIDGRCVPAAARLLVSPAQNSLKDSSAGTLVTLFHFFCSSSLYHSLSFPLTIFYQFLALLHHCWIVIFFLPSLFFLFFSPLLVDLQMQIGKVTFASLISITVVYCSVSVCTMHECPCSRVKMKAVATLCSALASPSLGDLVFISPDLAHILEYLLQVPALLNLTTDVRGSMCTELREKTRTRLLRNSEIRDNSSDW